MSRAGLISNEHVRYRIARNRKRRCTHGSNHRLRRDECRPDALACAVAHRGGGSAGGLFAEQAGARLAVAARFERAADLSRFTDHRARRQAVTRSTSGTPEAPGTTTQSSGCGTYDHGYDRNLALGEDGGRRRREPYDHQQRRRRQIISACFTNEEPPRPLTTSGTRLLLGIRDQPKQQRRGRGAPAPPSMLSPAWAVRRQTVFVGVAPRAAACRPSRQRPLSN